MTSLHKNFIENNPLKTITLENVRLTKDRMRGLVESLVIRGITSAPLIARPQPSTHTYKWSCGTDSVVLETTLHPYITSADSLTLIMTGTKDELAEINTVLEVLGAITPEQRREAVTTSVEYHTTLNPVVWEKNGSEYTIIADVEEAMLEIAAEFIEYLRIPGFEADDITLTGSSANFNWTATSDVDIHIVKDFKQATAEYGELFAEFVNTKKRLWNDLHSITIKQIPIEMYVQDSGERHHSTGVYSLMNQEWLLKPSHNPPTVNDIAIKEKTAAYIRDINEACASTKASVIEELHKRLVKMRQQGLEKGGEFSTENMVYKQLRSKGFLDKLAECKLKVYDRELSIEDEEWVM